MVINMRIGILTNPNPIFGAQLIRALAKEEIKIDLIIVDKKLTTLKDIKIHDNRTNNKYKVETLFNEKLKVDHIKFVENHNNSETINLIKKKKLDLLINGYTPRILNDKILLSTQLGALNCHPGILPYFRGCMAVEWSIFYDKPVGNTIHWMTKNIDEGPILKTKVSNLEIKMTYEEIRVQVQLDGINLLAQTIKKCILKKLDWKGKNQTNGSYFKPMTEIQFNKVINKIKSKQYLSREL
jgi:methionyl-tRNA formyltransferase